MVNEKLAQTPRPQRIETASSLTPAGHHVIGDQQERAELTGQGKTVAPGGNEKIEQEGIEHKQPEQQRSVVRRAEEEGGEQSGEGDVGDAAEDDRQPQRDLGEAKRADARPGEKSIEHVIIRIRQGTERRGRIEVEQIGEGLVDGDVLGHRSHDDETDDKRAGYQNGKCCRRLVHEE